MSLNIKSSGVSRKMHHETERAVNVIIDATRTSSILGVSGSLSSNYSVAKRHERCFLGDNIYDRCSLFGSPGCLTAYLFVINQPDCLHIVLSSLLAVYSFFLLFGFVHMLWVF